MTTEKQILGMCGMCSCQNWYYTFAYGVLYGNWVLDGCDECIICTTYLIFTNLFGIQKMVNLQKLYLKRYKIAGRMTVTI